MTDLNPAVSVMMDAKVNEPLVDDDPATEAITSARRVVRCATSVLGDSDAGRELRSIANQHIAAIDELVAGRGGDRVVIAAVGPAGQGKSWLVSQFVRDADLRRSIPSGNDRRGTTERLVWVGSGAPADIDTRAETFVQVPVESMYPLGVDYTIVDAPGATDDRGGVAAIARRALSIASVYLLVARRDQLRSRWVGMLAEASEGSIVVPIINFIRDGDEELTADVDSFLRRLRDIAPESRIAPAVYIRDFDYRSSVDDDRTGNAAGSSGDRDGGSDGESDNVGVKALRDIAARINDEVGAGLNLQDRRSARVRAMHGRFLAEVRGVLSDHLPHLTYAVDRIGTEARRLPGEVAETLVGGGAGLQSAVRTRLRVALMNETSPVFFPYRSQLGLLNLTHGAWDRVMLSLAGSVPSLVGAVYTTTQNLRASVGDRGLIEDGLRRRSDAAVAERLGPLARQFGDEIRRLRGEPSARVMPGESARVGDDDDSVATLSGLDVLQTRSSQIFESAIASVAVRPAVATISALVGAAIFWGMMAGPIVKIYTQYFKASGDALRGGGSLAAFPHGEFSFWLTSLAISILPTFLIAMLMLSWVQRRRLVRRAEETIKGRHSDAITQMQRDGTLRLRWNEPLLADAEFLLSIGATSNDQNDS